MDLLADSPTLLLFVVAGIGFLLARVRIGGFSLGVAAVLFAGIAVAALDEDLKLPEPVWQLGLVLFVYTVGLASGPGFVSALRRRGVAANGVAVGALVVASFTLLVGAAVAGLTAAVASGAFAGSLTNTPALAAVLQGLEDRTTPDEFDALAAEPIVGYGLTYPLGVLIPLLAVYVMLRRRGVTPAKPLVMRIVTVQHPPPGRTLGEIGAEHANAVTFGRLEREGTQIAATDDVVPLRGDLLTVVGVEEAVRRVVAMLGVESTRHVERERGELDFRRIAVSDARVAGRSIGDLDLGERFEASVTRVRRGDLDLVAAPELVLELGDRVRVVAPRTRMREISGFFGDSYRALGEVDVLTLSAGIAAGLLLGSVPFPLPGGDTFELGSAGGPLLVALTLGALGRTGPVVWQLPYTANLTLRQLGAVLFLAGVGTRAGQAFADTITDSAALLVIGVGALVTGVTVAVALVVGGRVLRLPSGVLAGVVAGVHTQPAVLAYAAEQVEDESEVNLGYATVYPVAMIVKILAAQLLLGATFDGG